MRLHSMLRRHCCWAHISSDLHLNVSKNREAAMRGAVWASSGVGWLPEGFVLISSHQCANRSGWASSLRHALCRKASVVTPCCSARCSVTVVAESCAWRGVLHQVYMWNRDPTGYYWRHDDHAATCTVRQNATFGRVHCFQVNGLLAIRAPRHPQAHMRMCSHPLIHAHLPTTTTNTPDDLCKRT